MPFRFLNAQLLFLCTLLSTSGVDTLGKVPIFAKRLNRYIIMVQVQYVMCKGRVPIVAMCIGAWCYVVQCVIRAYCKGFGGRGSYGTRVASCPV